MSQVYWNTFPIRVSIALSATACVPWNRHWLIYPNTPKDMLRYAVCLKEDDSIIGDVFALREYTDTFSVGWHFNQRFEGKGLAYEAATGLLDYLFHDIGARRIYGFVEDDNLRSKRLCERLGMRHEGCMKEFISFVCHPDGTPRYEDTCIYAILNKEWKSNRQR
jgi:ribosomal-protein-alanine N-acetyltransferase